MCAFWWFGKLTTTVNPDQRSLHLVNKCVWTTCLLLLKSPPSYLPHLKLLQTLLCVSLDNELVIIAKVRPTFLTHPSYLILDIKFLSTHLSLYRAHIPLLFTFFWCPVNVLERLLQLPYLYSDRYLELCLFFDGRLSLRIELDWCDVTRFLEVGIAKITFMWLARLWWLIAAKEDRWCEEVFDET